MKRVSFLLMSLLISTNVLATTTNLTFAGTAAAFCSFSGVNAGSMVVNPSNTAQIGTSVSGGTPGSFTIQYLGTPTVSIEESHAFTTKPNGVSDSDFSFTYAVASGSSVSYTSNQGYMTATYSGGSADQLTVQVLATKQNAQSVPLGNYAISSTVTCQ